MLGARMHHTAGDACRADSRSITRLVMHADDGPHVSDGRWCMPRRFPMHHAARDTCGWRTGCIRRLV